MKSVWFKNNFFLWIEGHFQSLAFCFQFMDRLLKSGVAGREQPSWNIENFLLPWRGRNSLCRQFLKDEPGRHKKRTDADSGQTPSVLKDRFGQRTLKNIRKWMETDGGRACFARPKDGSERRTEADDQPKRTKSVRRALVKVLVTEF